MFIFLPASLNVNPETYPRQNFYTDVHNYIRFKTPVFELAEILSSESSPLMRLERHAAAAREADETAVIYEAKLLSCVLRRALRRFLYKVDELSAVLCGDQSTIEVQSSLESTIRQTIDGTLELISRYRNVQKALPEVRPLQDKTRASLRLIDEYISLSIEQFFRKVAAGMERLPRTAIYANLRKSLMAEVIREEKYRKERQLKSVLSPTGENEEYILRVGFLKKFCMNILFLAARREQGRQGWEEVLFALAAGLAMAFATAVAIWAQARFTQVSLNFFLIAVSGYMMKDRIKEGLRRILSTYAARRLFDRSTVITDPVTKRRLGLCKEKVDYTPLGQVPEKLTRLRQTDDFVTASRGELAETIIRYQKRITLHSDELPRIREGITGVTDIIRFNVDHILRDMDDPEYALEYIDLDDLTVAQIRAAKSYEVDVALRFDVEDAGGRSDTCQLVRLVLDRNGIKRLQRFDPPGFSKTAVTPIA